jgi:ATP-dependent DNA helicase DinG
VAFGLALANAPEGRFTTELPADLAEAIVVVRDETRKLVTALKPEGATEVDGPLKIAQSAALVTFEIADRLANACNEGSEGEVIWVTRNDDGHSRLYIAPRDVGHLIDDLTTDITGVFTSATLMIGGKFDAVARSLGLPLGGYRAVDVGSPFDYPSQGILYIASHLETPGRASSIESQLDEIEALIRAAGGRTLGLFSSRRAATLAAEAMRERLDTAVLLQGEDQLPTQLAEFAADASASLFGSFSLWQGVDVPGSACQLVIIDRLGFPRPDDPVMSARAEAVAQAGGNGFMAVTATHTALRLAQAAGRLIRTSADKGVVAVLDPRLVKARYGEFLIRSLPDFWRTTDQATVLAALARLDVAASQP